MQTIVCNFFSQNLRYARSRFIIISLFAGELLELAGKTSCLHAVQLEVTNTESYPEVVKQVNLKVANNI